MKELETIKESIDKSISIIKNEIKELELMKESINKILNKKL
jgi:hypothetical protein